MGAMAYYATSSPFDKITAIVGPDLSEAAQAVSAIAGLTGTPVTSYFATSTLLSDKSKFPFFSRTIPVQTFNMIGLASIIAAFGWSQCAVLYTDTAYGISFAADFQQRAQAAGVSILLLQKFADQNPSSIRAGASALRDSGARIFVFLSQANSNLEAILLAGRDAGIAGRDGYAWIASELNLQDLAPPAPLRPLLLGWLTLTLDARHAGGAGRRFDRAYAAADPRAIYDPSVRLPPAALAPPRSAYDAFAYDAVWATALGIAGAARGAGGAELAAQIRAARFVGASGPVAFDNATGDRAADGMEIQVACRRSGPRRRTVRRWRLPRAPPRARARLASAGETRPLPGGPWAALGTAHPHPPPTARPIRFSPAFPPLLRAPPPRGGLPDSDHTYLLF